MRIGDIMRRTMLLVCCVWTCNTYSQTNQYPKLLIVAQDGSGDHVRIQDAVNAVRDLSQEQVVIKVGAGTYREKLIIPSWKTNILLIGESNATTIITNGDYSGKEFPGEKDVYGRSKFSTYTSYTVLIQGNDCIVENLTIENSSGRVGQGVALHIEGDRTIIRGCRILGNQDTLYAATENSRQYYRECYIEGTTDFIFGEATAVFQNCLIKSLANSFITAAATTPRQNFGFVFISCKLIADAGVKECFLGRPWRPYAKTIFIKTEMGEHIHPQAWHNWDKPENERTAFYAEYGNTGPGSIKNERTQWSKFLTQDEVSMYTFGHIFNDWNPPEMK